jgi:hypothetical protein
MRKSFNQRRLQFQHLENRNLLAGLVHVNYSGGVLSIDGDEFGNGVHIEVNQLDTSLTSVVIEADPGTTLIDNGSGNGLPSTLLAYNLDPNADDIWIDMGGGDDDLDIHNDVGADSKLADDVQIALGSGDDFLSFGSTGRIFVDDDLTIGGNAGDDTIILDNVRVFGRTTISGKSGADDVSLSEVNTDQLDIATHDGADAVSLDDVLVQTNATIDTGAGDTTAHGDSVSIADSRIKQDLWISTGPGPDSVAIDSSRIDRHTTILTGSEADSVDIDASHFGRKLDIDTGSGHDTVTIHTSKVGKALNLSTGTGDDEVEIGFSDIRAFVMNTGDGNDSVTLDFNLIRKFSSLDTEDGADVVVLTDNIFDDQLLIDMGTQDDASLIPGHPMGDSYEAHDNEFNGGSVSGVTDGSETTSGNVGAFSIFTEVDA